MGERGWEKQKERERSKNETPPLMGLQVDTPPHPPHGRRCRQQQKQGKALAHPTIRKMRKEMSRITGGEEKTTTLAALW